MKTKLHELLTVHSASVPTLRTWSKYGDDWQLINIVWKQSLDVSANGCKTYRSVFSGGEKKRFLTTVGFRQLWSSVGPTEPERTSKHSLARPPSAVSETFGRDFGCRKSPRPLCWQLCAASGAEELTQLAQRCSVLPSRKGVLRLLFLNGLGVLVGKKDANKTTANDVNLEPLPLNP